MVSESELIRKRAYVGCLSIGSTVIALIILMDDFASGVGAALLRVGLILGAFWLALPTRDRPAAWARVSPWSVGLLVAFALLLPRVKPVIPVLIIGVLIGWIVRPRNRNGP